MLVFANFSNLFLGWKSILIFIAKDFIDFGLSEKNYHLLEFVWGKTFPLFSFVIKFYKSSNFCCHKNWGKT